MKENTLITITRQYGSGGREVADNVAKKLGVKFYDRKIVTKAAENLGSGGDIHSIIADAYDTPDDFFSNIAALATQGVPYQNQMYKEQAKVILTLAKEGTAVFMGRCADYILRDEPNVYSFFIYANEDFRRERAKLMYKGASVKDLQAVDKQRKRYYAYYTGQVWGEPQNYDLMINTSKLALPEAADLIINYVELRQKEQQFK